MKRTNIFIAVWLFVFLVGSMAYVDANEKQVVKIGAILPLTGNLAFLGEPERNALILANEDLKKANIPVELIIEDSKGTATDGIAAVNKLIAQGVSAVVVSTTGINLAVLPIAKQHNIIIFTQCMAPSITSENKYAFRIFPNYVTEQQITAKYMQKKAYKTAALYYANSAGIKPEADSFKTLANDFGIKIIFEDTFDVGQKDFKSSLFKIKQARPDVILILAYGDSYPPMFKQLKELKINIPIVGNVALEQLGATQLGTKIYEGAAFPSFSVAQRSTGIIEFRKRYYKQFGSYPGGFLDYPYFYDVVRILGDTLQTAQGDTDKAQGILHTQTFKGITGEIKFSEVGDFSPPLAMGVYRSGKVVPAGLK